RLSKINDEYVEKYLVKKNVKNLQNAQVISPEGIGPEIISKDLEIKSEQNISSSIGNFFMEYSKFEDSINNYYKKLVESTKKPSFTQQIKELNRFNIIPDNLYHEINDIRIFRNALAHTSHQMELDKNLIDNLNLRIRNINEQIKETIESSK
uniref:hypothetical protein n=1 Tax=Acinetobacter bereziniae TaxID=106648 RepID=UPI00148EFDFD